MAPYSLLMVFLAISATVGEARIGLHDKWVRPSPAKAIDMRHLASSGDLASPQQINLRIVGENDGTWTYLVQFATNNSVAAPSTTCAAWIEGNSDNTIQGTGSSSVYSDLVYEGSYSLIADNYHSPYLHKCELTGLKPSQTYLYNALGSDETMSFTTPPLVNPTETFSAIVMADVGQTNYSNMTMALATAEIVEKGISTVIWPGDVSYADGYQPRWDTFGRLAQQMTSRAETVWSPGNHELYKNEAFVAYQQRYAGTGPMWFVTQRGPMTLISLCTYCGVSQDSAQYRWLESTLEEVDRSLTPWLVVMFHEPFYSSNVYSEQLPEYMREQMEPLLFKYGVDVIFTGHIHAYERTHPVYNFTVTECAPVHIIIGDGGNYEEVSNTYYMTPQWSAERDASFGYGTFNIIDANLANWTWKRNPDGYYEYPDQTPWPVMPEYHLIDAVQWNRTACRQ